MSGLRHHLLLVAGGLLLLIAAQADAQVYPPGGSSPHDAAHLISLPASQFQAESAAAQLRPILDRGSSFPAGSLPVDARLSAPIVVRHGGKYAVWARLGVAQDRRLPVEFSLSQAGKPVLSQTVGQTAGAAGQGGPAGYQAYAKQARSGKLFQDVVINPGPDAGSPRGSAKDDALELLAELKAESSGKPAETEWVTASRLEQPLPERPFYWWKLGEVELTPGEYTLAAHATGKHAPREVLFDGAFLSTRLDVEYPFAGDVTAPPASYVRFRIDDVPEGGVNISARMRIHRDPWQTGAASLNPDKASITGSDPHTKAGLTRWYRLQDLENAPGFGSAQCHLLLQIAAVKQPDAPLRGATQLAIFPHGDYVLREFDWSEPGTDQITLATDFATHLDQVRTVRDQAREHYQYALDATAGEVFPLTRGDLSFTNSWGAASGEAVDYMNQTLRLLGFNSVGRAKDPVKYARLYGGSITGGHYWPPAYVPFEPAESVAKYDAYYRDYFAKDADRYQAMSTFQVADEPGEIRRREMTSPYWKLVTDAKGPAWADLSGDSSLFTRRTDLADCVLEGEIEKHGAWVGFYVGVDQTDKPANYAFWRLGQVSVDRTMNLSAGLVVDGGVRPGSLLNRPGASLAKTATPFKIVYDGQTAALYLRDKLIHQLTDLPKQGGFAMVGGAKSFRSLQLRKLRPEERLSAPSPVLDKKPEADILAELGLDDKADKPGEAWARPKPLAQAVREDWLIAGGMPHAHAGFRRWAAEQGLTPALFGKEKWDDVRMLTLQELVETPAERRLYYWSRRYSGWLTPRMFQMAAEAIRRQAPRQQMQSFVALSGHSLYFPSEQPLDMFELANSPAITPGVSDWMSLGSWFWDSHQAVAYSVAPYNAGARRYGEEPLNHPMMHCVWPSAFRSYTMLANQVRTVSYFNYGPSYAVTEGYWSDNPGSYHAVHRTNNHSALVDDVLANANMRPARVAMLYSMSNEYWQAQSSFADKRATFLALSHEYYQPELVTEQQVAAGALDHYDALLVLDPLVADTAQEKIADWVRGGGLLWTCADALTRNQYNEPADLLASLASVRREFAEADGPPAKPAVMSPADATSKFRPHTVAAAGRASKLTHDGARLVATYDNGQPAWLEQQVERGRVVYLGHRAGLTYMSKKIRTSGRHSYFADTARAPLIQPLLAAAVERELVLSEPCVVASPLSCSAGTVIVLYNMNFSPCVQLQVGLRESKLPHSVEVFDGDRLVPLPHQLRDGRLWMELPELAAEQMILVRYAPAPADPRRDETLASAKQHLASTDSATLAAGAWLAGRLPKADVDARLAEFLRHDAWIVRRAAAESIGRRGNQALLPNLQAALADETDPHVLADQLLALAQLGDPQLAESVGRHLTHPREIVRRSAVEALSAQFDQESQRDKIDRATAQRIAEQALADPDGRVVRAGIALLSRLDPAATLRGALAFFAEEPSRADRATAAAWVTALTQRDANFEQYMNTNSGGGLPLLLAVSAQRKDPRLAALLRDLPTETLAELDGELVSPALRQCDPALARRLFAERENLPRNLAGHVTLILQATFNIRLGNVPADWQDWLNEQPAAE